MNRDLIKQFLMLFSSYFKVCETFGNNCPQRCFLMVNIMMNINPGCVRFCCCNSWTKLLFLRIICLFFVDVLFLFSFVPNTPPKCLLPSDMILTLVPANNWNAFTNSWSLTMSHVLVGLKDFSFPQTVKSYAKVT